MVVGLIYVGLAAIAGSEFVPLWYVPACVGFDLVVAGGILATSVPVRRQRQVSDTA